MRWSPTLPGPTPCRLNADGYKLSDEAETEIETRCSSNLSPYLADAASLGRARRLDDARGRYNEYVKQTFPKGFRLDGLKIAIDCANGAAYKVGPEVLWELGAEIIPIGVDPDGVNINKGCGSTGFWPLDFEKIQKNFFLDFS